jgi:hypothetical protein
MIHPSQGIYAEGEVVCPPRNHLIIQKRRSEEDVLALTKLKLVSEAFNPRSIDLGEIVGRVYNIKY